MLNALASLSGKIASVDENGFPLSFTMGVQELKSPSDAKLLVRGEIDQPAQTVPRGFPQVLTKSSVKIGNQSSGRLEFARWIGSEDNPLTARVMVNRIWQHLIGQGIVTSTENFGTTGQMPSHPELLDYLAVRFVESGWSIKDIIREIATSRVYRMTSAYNKTYHEKDPDNHLLWRANPRRLDAEVIRDAMLSLSGEIDLDRPQASEVAKAGFTRVQNGRLGNASSRMSERPNFQPGMRPQGGAQFRPGSRPMRGRFPFGGQLRPGQQRPGQQRPGQQRPGQQRPGQQRPGQRFGRPGGRATNPLDMESAKFRSVYLPIVREEEPRSLHVFDFADSSTITGKRESSDTADQSLYMMNNPFVIQQSFALARRLTGANLPLDEQMERAFLLAYGRRPTKAERTACARFFKTFKPSGSDSARTQKTWAAFCQSLLASAEFRYLD